MAVGLYVHVPFCALKCAYCDFNSYAGKDELIEPYLRALKWEMRQRAQESCRAEMVLADCRAASAGSSSAAPLRAGTLYIGGGTPSHLPAGCIEDLLTEIWRRFEVVEDAEVTVEANPADLDIGRLRSMRAAGVNRVSIGVQSFDDDVLRFLARRHDAGQARRAVEIARSAGFENVSIDLIYAVPGQAIDGWTETLEEALAISPNHISAYSLTIEQGTCLGALVAQGVVAPVGNDTQAKMYEIACSMLESAGYEHYEISNFARPGFRCRHNETYWRNEDYLGLGAGAHSYLDGVRWWNVRDPELYTQCISAGFIPVAGAERLCRQEQMSETLMLALRTSDGAAEEVLERRFGKDLWRAHRNKILAEVGKGSARFEGGRLVLAREAFVIADRVCETLV